MQIPGKEAESFDDTTPWWYVIAVMRVEVAGDETGESFGIGRIEAKAGQTVRVVVIVAYRALGIMVLSMNVIEDGKRYLER